MRRTVTAVLMALVVPAVVLAAPGDEDARADDSVGRPADGTFTLQGHGFGHGRA